MYPWPEKKLAWRNPLCTFSILTGIFSIYQTSEKADSLINHNNVPSELLGSLKMDRGQWIPEDENTLNIQLYNGVNTTPPIEYRKCATDKAVHSLGSHLWRKLGEISHTCMERKRHYLWRPSGSHCPVPLVPFLAINFSRVSLIHLSVQENEAKPHRCVWCETSLF